MLGALKSLGKGLVNQVEMLVSPMTFWERVDREEKERTDNEYSLNYEQRKRLYELLKEKE